MSAPAFLRIAVPSPLRRYFDYLPPAGDAPVPLGVRVRIPFGRATLIGIVVAHVQHSAIAPERLKRVSAVLDDTPLLSASLIKLLSWASAYYHHPPGEVFASALPIALRSGGTEGRAAARWILSAAGEQVDPAQLSRAPRQARLMHLLRTHREGLDASSLAVLEPNGQGVMKRMQQLGWVALAPLPNKFAPAFSAAVLENAPPLNPAQHEAVGAVTQALGRFQSFLLEGVTGSGKTEVYLQIAAHVLARAQQVLILVPEIGLTPQIAQRFRQRFAAPITVMHSGLGERARLAAWSAAQQGGAAIVIGTRSAVFTPLPKLGAIIVDEDHDISFKQQDGFRYSARDVAVMRAREEGVVVVLGSATPSLEGLHNVQAGRYQLLRLPRRAGAALPPRVHVVDMKLQPLDGSFSQALLGAMHRHLDAGHQVLLFLNRRGFAPALMCYACGWIATCARCDAHLTLHHAQQRLRCHHCGAERAIDVACPACKGGALHGVGAGTERIEHTLPRLFPGVGITRIDRDSTRRKGSLEALFGEIHVGESRILIGTQMLAKGHHFPHVTLAGILNTDQGLFGTDFRAGERMAQLIVQVAGRAGRGAQPGEVLIQTHHPGHPLLGVLLEHGYGAFAAAALEERRAARLPPFSYLALLRAEALQRAAPLRFLELARTALPACAVQVLGPIPAPMEKRAGRYRAQLLVQAPGRAQLQRFLDQWLPHIEALKEARTVRWSLDVDPQEMY